MALTEKYVSSTAGGAGTGTSEASPYTWQQMIDEIKSASGTGGRGNRYNVKADGTYSLSSTSDIGGGGSGTNALPVMIRGYKTTIGDGYLGRTNDNGALMTTNLPVITYSSGQQLNSGQHMAWESLNFTMNNGGFAFQSEHNTHIFGCSITQNSAEEWSRPLKTMEGTVVWECDIMHPATSGPAHAEISMEGSGGKLISNRIIIGSPAAWGVQTERWTLLFGNLIKGGGGGTGVYQEWADRPVTIINNTIVGWQHGIRFNEHTTWPVVCWGNMITDCTGYAVNGAASGDVLFFGPNRVRDCVSGIAPASVDNDWAQAGRFWPIVTTDTGGPETDYTNAASGDYRLIAASPARNANRPKFSDLGAYSMQDPEGGTLVGGFHPLVPQIIRPAPND